MKCKFERKTVYANQVFLAGRTYDLPKRDAAALGFCKPAKTEPETTVNKPAPVAPETETGETEAK